MAPATWGVAIDVPEMVVIALSELTHAAVIALPGAHMSTQGPWLEKEDLASDDVDEATVIAVGSDAGEAVQASTSSFPAACGGTRRDTRR